MFLIAGTLIAATGCDRQPVAPTAEPDVGAAVFNFNNNPDGGSLHIYRSQYYAFFLLFDTESTLVSVLSSTPDCGGFLEPADVQNVVEDPYDVIHSRVQELMKADPINIFIVDLSQDGACFGYDLVAWAPASSSAPTVITTPSSARTTTRTRSGSTRTAWSWTETAGPGASTGTTGPCGTARISPR